MAKYTDAKCRQCRREGCKLFLKGERCTSGKCAIDRRPVVPGQHGAARKKVTEYGLQLREKQKVRRAYGLLERQFENLYEEHLWGSYNKYSHTDTEIIIAVTPKYVEIWDTSEDNYAYQIFIDFDKKSVEIKQYDQK